MPDAIDLLVRDLLARPDVQRARAFITDDDARTLRQQRQLTEIPAPPFAEGPRAARMLDLMEEAGLDATGHDAEGNVLGWLGEPPTSGAVGLRPLVISAHLDTIFPEGTDVRVRQQGDRLVGPGISDDGRGLAALLALARALVHAGVRPQRPVLFAATVGEEGEGDLRGVRYLFREDGPLRSAHGFVSLDGAGLSRLVTGGLGSRRFRLTARGPGGHSWVDWGTPNPIHALGRAVAAFTELTLPRTPRTTLSVGRWSGGTSVNAIPQDAWVELEVRSEALPELDRLDGAIRSAARAAVGAANQGSNGRGRVELTIEVIGDRPAARTEPSSRLVRAAVAATRSVGVNPELAISSTDSNIPMSLGIQAVTMGAGGEAGMAHTTEEWYRNESGPDGILRALLTVMAAAEPNG